MIEAEVMVQLRALSEQIAKINDDMLRLSARLDANYANLFKHVEVEIALVRDGTTRATNKITEFGGLMDSLEDEQSRYKTDFEWWVTHLDQLSKKTDETLKKLSEAETRIASDNSSFKTWAIEKISQIGRIYRR